MRSFSMTKNQPDWPENESGFYSHFLLRCLLSYYHVLASLGAVSIKAVYLKNIIVCFLKQSLTVRLVKRMLFPKQVAFIPKRQRGDFLSVRRSRRGNITPVSSSCTIKMKQKASFISIKLNSCSAMNQGRIPRVSRLGVKVIRRHKNFIWRHLGEENEIKKT